MLVSALKKDSKKVHINLSEKLAAISLKDFPQICLPNGDLVDNIASKAASLVDKGVKKPFICVELKEFLPYWAHDKRDDESSEGASFPSLPLLYLLNFALSLQMRMTKKPLSGWPELCVTRRRSQAAGSNT